MVMLVEKLQGQTLKRKWVPLKDISPNLRLAVVASEDGNFCRHWGVDWGAVRDAIKQAHSWKAVRGASTIPMQVGKKSLPVGATATMCARRSKCRSPM